MYETMTIISLSPPLSRNCDIQVHSSQKEKNTHRRSARNKPHLVEKIAVTAKKQIQEQHDDTTQKRHRCREFASLQSEKEDERVSLISSSADGKASYQFVTTSSTVLSITPLASIEIDQRCQNSFNKVLERYEKRQIKLGPPSVELAETNKKAEEVLSWDESECILPASVEIRHIDDEVGYGVFAKRSIKKGEFLGEYTGVIRTLAKAKKEDPGMVYSFDYGFNTIYAEYGLEAKSQGNFARFINHAPEKKANLQSYLHFNSKGPHIMLVATKAIKAGSQITFDYGNGYWNRKKITPQVL